MYYENYNENQGEEKAFIKWINSLGLTNELGESIHVNNLYEDLKNGLILLNIIDKIKPGVVNWKIVDKKPNNPFKITVNCNEVIDACRKLKCQIRGIGGGDIRDGNKNYILKIIWEIMKTDILKKIGNKTEEELISWGNERVDSDLRIKSLKDKTLDNSLYFINIIQSIEPRAINWNIVIKNKNNKESKKNNAIYVISISKQLGAKVFLDWEDIVEVNSKLLFTFLATLYYDLFLNKSNVKNNVEPTPKIGKTEPYKTNFNSFEETSNKEISKLKLDLDNERNNNKELVKKISKLEKELNDEKNKNKILEENISNLKNELENLLNKTKKQEEKIQNRNSNNNSKESLYETILEKDKEIKNLKLKLSRYPVELDEGEELMSVIFISGDQKLHCSIICKNTDKFNRVEDRLYDYYSEYAENENYFTFNGIKINKYKTLKDNNIKNNNIIMLNTIE